MQPLRYREDVTQGQFLSRVQLVRMNSEFSFLTNYHTKARELAREYVYEYQEITQNFFLTCRISVHPSHP